MTGNLVRHGAVSLLLALLTACATGPAYERPQIDVPARFKETTLTPEQARQWKHAQPADSLARGQWWTVFGDANLNALQVRALQANHDLEAAAARVSQARSMQKRARADRLPDLDAGVGPLRQRSSTATDNGSGRDATNPVTTWRAQTELSYEVDLFGRIKSEIDAATADAQRAAALYESVKLALQADVAQNYFLIGRLDAEAELYASTVHLRALNLDLVNKRHDEGDISGLDVARAQSELAAARAQLHGIARQRAAAEHAMAVLLGTAPADFSMPAKPLSTVQVAIPAGLPSSLLERRPDIAAAERAMAGANARIGAAQAAFFPRLLLTGTFGFESSELRDLARWSSRSFILGPVLGTALSLPIFDGGRRQGELDRARARYEEDVAQYRQTVLQAFRDVEDSLSALRLLGEQSSEQELAVASALQAAALSQDQYREGMVSYLEVIDADRAALQHKRVAVQLNGRRAEAAVQLIRAIGGGWDDI